MHETISFIAIIESSLAKSIREEQKNARHACDFCHTKPLHRILSTQSIAQMSERAIG
jgi:hypothetical protein